MSKSSVVWDYFTLIGDKVKCDLCPTNTYMNYNRSSTSNMMRHLRLRHVTADLSKRKRLDEEVDNPGITEPASNLNLVSPLVLYLS